ncbi:MAG: SpoIID/LytB domain-containing protein, partial [Acutalibacteraceae bacterium]
QTQSAKTVWGEDIPYLKSVKADGDELSPDFDQTVKLTEKQFKEKAEAAGIKDLSGNSKDWFSITDQNKSGYVTKAKIGSESLTGAEVRRILSLDSAVFTFSYQDGAFTFKTKGIGHQIGMSQYCADYMARQGKNYKEILLHFYPGTTLTGNTVQQK